MREAHRRERQRERRAKVVRVDFSRPLEPVDVEDRYGEALLVASWGDTVVGEAFVPVRGSLQPARQLSALSGAHLRAIVRQAVRAALDGPLTGGSDSMRAPAVSVVVCTRDRPGDLRRCLDALLALRTEPAEILVVDNAPETEETRALCSELPVRYVHEPIPGQTRARNRGVAESRGDVVAFTDDDCVPDPGWLDDLARPFADPLVMAVTGYVGPLELETEAQWLFEHHGGFKSHPGRRVIHWEKDPPLVGGPRAGNGANMIIRRAAFAHAGPFAEDLGPGTPARSSDDKELFCRLLAHGFRIVHEPNRIVWHRHRRDEAGLRRIMRDYGVSEFAYATRFLVRERELDAVRIWAWWIRHYGSEIAAALGRRSPFPLWLTLEEMRGAASGPLAMLRSTRSRRGIAPLDGVAPAERPPDPSPAVRSEPPDVTVAIASRNRRDSLRRTLESLARQEDPGARFEVVAVLDGSTDGSGEMARGFDVGHPLRVVEQEPLGLAAARNRGAREAANPVVVFLDDDIEALPGFVAGHGAAHAASGERVVVGPFPPASPARRLWEMRVNLWWLDHFRRKAAPGHRMTYVDFVDGNSSMPTAVLERLGGFDEGFPGGRRQDWELGMRMLKAGVELVYEPSAAGRHHLLTTGAGSLRNARQEGHNDVLLAARHPEALAHLPLSWAWEPLRVALRRLEGMRRLLDSDGGIERVASALDALEAARMRKTWLGLADFAVRAQYANGICDALPDPEERAAFFAPLDTGAGVTHLELRLEQPEPIVLPPAGGAVEVTLTWQGQALGTVPATRLGHQWDADELADRLADTAAPSLALAAVAEAIR